MRQNIFYQFTCNMYSYMIIHGLHRVWTTEPGGNPNEILESLRLPGVNGRHRSGRTLPCHYARNWVEWRVAVDGSGCLHHWRPQQKKYGICRGCCCVAENCSNFFLQLFFWVQVGAGWSSPWINFHGSFFKRARPMMWWSRLRTLVRLRPCAWWLLHIQWQYI